MKHLNLKTSIFLIFIASIVYAQQKDLIIKGTIKDETNYGIPYAAIGIRSKYIGTSSNEDGNFNLELSKSNLLDTLEVSSIGYTTSKITVKDFIALEKSIIVLKEDIVSLDEVKILSPGEYVKLAIKNLKQNTASSRCQLILLNRVFYLEEDQAKYFIEHYVKLNDAGPSSHGDPEIEIVEGRKSADYRMIKDQIHTRTYPIYFMNTIDPLRRDISLGDYKWSKIGDSSYDGEDIVIIQGEEKSNKRNNYLNPVFYIGIDTYKVYKTTNMASNVVFLYQKNNEGKLYLSYHYHYNRQFRDLTPQQMVLLKVKNKRGMKLSKRNEIIVLNAEFDKKKININSTQLNRTVMEDAEFKYNSDFWTNFILPPPTEYYKNSVIQLESNFGVPIETQFKLVN